MKKMSMIMTICLLLCMAGTPVLAQNREWECDNCGRYNDFDYNFCGNCGQERGIIYKNDSEKSTAQSTSIKWRFGKQILYNNGYIYVAGNDGIFRVDSQNEYEYILANDSFADAFFAVNDTIYFVKYNQDHFEDASLYQYDSSKGIASKLCSSGFYGSIVGAEGGKVYFLQISNEDAWGNELISYNIEKDEKTVLAENVGKAYFWNGSVIYTGYASDISPVAIYRMDTNGNRELITENGSQNLYVDYEEAYYIDYKMTNNISWEQASVNRITENTIEELSGLSGSYITPEIHGKIDDYLLVSCNQDNTNHYYQIDTAASEGNIYEMDVPENATYMSLFQDEYRNRYYYANQKIFYWRGAGYECIAEIPPDATVIGVMGGYVFYYVYSSTGNPKLIQTICK